MILTRQERRTVQAALVFWARACRHSNVHPTTVPFIAELFGPKDSHPLSPEQVDQLVLAIGADGWDEQVVTLTGAARALGFSLPALKQAVRHRGIRPVCQAGLKKFYRPADIEGLL